MLLNEACAHFFHHCQTANSLSEHTLRAYRHDLKDITQFLGLCTELKDITKDEIRRYIGHMREQRKLKETTIKRRIACMKLLFKWLQQEAAIPTNPFDTLNEKIRLPKRLPRALDVGDLSLLRKAISIQGSESHFDQACASTAIRLLLESGIRVGELAAIKLDDLSLSDRAIRIRGKGNRQRLAYLTSATLHKAITQYLQLRLVVSTDATHLFVTEEGAPLTPAALRTSLRKMSTSVGVSKRVTPHMLRHTCASQWLEGGLDIRYVQKLLGHQSISTTEIYTHVSDKQLRLALNRVVGGRHL